MKLLMGKAGRIHNDSSRYSTAAQREVASLCLYICCHRFLYISILCWRATKKTPTPCLWQAPASTLLAPIKPKGKPGRPFVRAHGGGSRKADPPWVGRRPLGWKRRNRTQTRRGRPPPPPPAGNPNPALTQNTLHLHRAPVGQGPSGPDWLATALGFWSGRVLATGTAWAFFCCTPTQNRDVQKAMATDVQAQ